MLLEYFTFDGICFKLHVVDRVHRMRFTDDGGNVTVLEDEKIHECINMAMANYRKDEL